MQNVVMQSVLYADCRKYVHYAECWRAECRGAILFLLANLVFFVGIWSFFRVHCSSFISKKAFSQSSVLKTFHGRKYFSKLACFSFSNEYVGDKYPIIGAPYLSQVLAMLGYVWLECFWQAPTNDIAYCKEV